MSATAAAVDTSKKSNLAPVPAPKPEAKKEDPKVEKTNPPTAQDTVFKLLVETKTGLSAEEIGKAIKNTNMSAVRRIIRAVGRGDMAKGYTFIAETPKVEEKKEAKDGEKKADAPKGIANRKLYRLVPKS